MAEMKLDRPYMELHDGQELNLGGYPIHTPSQEQMIAAQATTEELRAGFQRNVVSGLDDVVKVLWHMSDQLHHIEQLLERLERPWYVRFWECLFRS